MERFRLERLGRDPIVLPPRDHAWRSVAPGFRGSLALIEAGVPFQVAAGRRYDRSADRSRLADALAAGETIFVPQVHQVLPRLMRLMVALRVGLFGPFRDECSFLFAVEGRGRAGMGLHHDGEVDAIWLQLEGRRTVTIGPRVEPGTPEDLDDRLATRGRRRGWRTRALEPGALFYMPPRTPHRVVCSGRSLALSLTWRPRGGRRRTRPGSARALASPRADAAGLTAWDVVPGQVDAVPPVSRDRVWTQIPTIAGPIEPSRMAFPIWTPGGGEIWLPAAVRPLASGLAMMPSARRAALAGSLEGLSLLLTHGILAPRDLPLAIMPGDPGGLDGWRFA